MERYFRYCFDSSLEEPSGEPPGTFECASDVLLSPQRSSIYILNASKMIFYKGVTGETVFRVRNCLYVPHGAFLTFHLRVCLEVLQRVLPGCRPEEPRMMPQVSFSSSIMFVAKHSVWA